MNRSVFRATGSHGDGPEVSPGDPSERPTRVECDDRV